MQRLFFHFIFIAVAGYIIFTTVQFRNAFVAAQNQASQSHNQYLELQKALRSRPQKLLFVGDIMLDRGVRERIEAAQDPPFPFLFVRDTLRQADIAFANLEGPITDRGVRSGSIYSFRFEPVGTVNALADAGFDILSLANNHILDYDGTGLADTLSILSKNGLSGVGAGKNYTEANTPIFITRGDARYAFLAYTNLYPESLEAGETLGVSDFGNAEHAIRDAREAADIVIVSLHWGEEYRSVSNEYQRSIAHAFIDAGADLIVGHHPHVAQELERYRGGYIAYSLGNFVFDQAFSEETRRGAMLEVIVQKNQIESARLIPISISSEFQPDFEH